MWCGENWRIIGSYPQHDGAAERLDLPNAQHVVGEELPCLPPALAIWRKGDVGRAIHEDVGDHGVRP